MTSAIPVQVDKRRLFVLYFDVSNFAFTAFMAHFNLFGVVLAVQPRGFRHGKMSRGAVE